MTIGIHANKAPRVGAVGRGAVLVAAATVTALVPAAAASAGVHALATGDITTVTGGKAPGPAPATSVAFSPCGVSFANNSVYAAAGQTVRQVAMAGGQLTTPAGTGSFGPLGDGGLATRSDLSQACGTAVDGSGNLIIADTGNNRLRLVAATTGTFYGQAMHKGDIYTIAGGGSTDPADGIPATSAFIRPNGVALDAAGNLIIADQSNKLILVVAVKTGTFYGRSMTAGDIYIVAGGGFNGLGDGGPATFAEVSPVGVALDVAGNLIIADSGNNRVRVVADRTGTFYGQAMTAGDIYTVAGNGSWEFAGDGGRATKAQLSADGVVVDKAGNLVIADSANGRIRVVAVRTGTFYGQAMTAGDIYTVAGTDTTKLGDGGPATKAKLSADGVALDSAGNLVIADGSDNRVRVVAVKAGTFYGQAMKARHIYTVAGNGLTSYSGDGGPSAEAQLSVPQGVTVDAAGNQVIADTANNRMRVTAAATGTFYGIAMTAGNVYTVAGNGRPDFAATFTDSGVPATTTPVRPGAVVLDKPGNLVIGEGRGIRVLAVKTGTFYGRAMTAGDIYTVAGNGTVGFSGDGGPATGAEFNGIGGVAVDAAGNLVLSDNGNWRIRVVAARTGTFYGLPMTAGDVYTIANANGSSTLSDGVPAITSGLVNPDGVALDAAGNVLIADSGHHRFRVIAETTGTFYGQAMTAGDIYTVAGGGSAVPGNGGPAAEAEIYSPAGVTVDSHGNLILTDDGFPSATNPSVRVVAVRTGTFYGQAMTAGDIYTVAGGNPPGFSGDGGPATSAELNGPGAVAVDGAGNLLIADSANNRIREVAG